MSPDPTSVDSGEPRGSFPEVVPTFGSAKTERGGIPVVVWAVSGLILLLALGALLLATNARRGVATGVVLAPDAYARNLIFSDLAMSESESLSGGKSTFLDGRVRNDGPQTVMGATLQVLFANDQALPPQVETVPLMLVRTREPSVDLQQLSSVPLVPGASREFRLIFEGIGANWNQQMPQVHVVGVRVR